MTTDRPGSVATRGRGLVARLGVGLALGLLAGLLVKDLDLPLLFSYWHPRGPLVVGVTVVLALLHLTRLRAVVVAVALALSSLWAIVAFTPLDAWLLPGVVRVDAPADADAVFVFASALQPDGEPTTVSMSRLVRGLELLGEHRAPRIVLSELRPPQAQYAPVARAWMEHLGVKGELLTVGPVDSTHDEGVAVGALCRARGWRRIIAVTSPTHSRRASAVLEHEGLTVISQPSIETRFDLTSLRTSDERVSAFGNVAHDTIGLWVYRRRGFIDRDRR